MKLEKQEDLQVIIDKLSKLAKKINLNPQKNSWEESTRVCKACKEHDKVYEKELMAYEPKHKNNT